MQFLSVFVSVLYPDISQFQWTYFSSQAEDGQEPKVDLFRWDKKERSDDEVRTCLLARWLFHIFFYVDFHGEMIQFDEFICFKLGWVETTN